MAVTETTGGTTQPDLIDFINNQMGVDFNTFKSRLLPGRKIK
jgi:hypothetical protein